MTETNAQASSNDDAQARPEAKKRSFRTLVVEGSHFLTPAVETALEAQGHLVLLADSAKSALAQTRQFQPELILLYMGTDPAKDLELLGELLIEQASAAVVVVAGVPSISQAVETIKLGALDYLEQPLDARKISQLIEAQEAWFKDDAAAAD